SAVVDAAADADLLIAEAYFRDKHVPYHLRHADLRAHRDRLTARRTIVTHMSADVLDHPQELCFEPAHDRLVIQRGRQGVPCHLGPWAYGCRLTAALPARSGRFQVQLSAFVGGVL